MRYLKLFEAFGKTAPIEVKFRRFNCVLEFGEYENGRTAIDLIDKRNGELVLGATVNVPEVKIADDEVIIKDYGGNEGIVDILVKAGVISEPVRTIETGYVKVPVVKLLKSNK